MEKYIFVLVENWTVIIYCPFRSARAYYDWVCTCVLLGLAGSTRNQQPIQAEAQGVIPFHLYMISKG